MSWFNKWVLALLPGVLLALRINLETDPEAKKTFRGICVAICRSSKAILMTYADDPTFGEEVNKP